LVPIRPGHASKPGGFCPPGFSFGSSRIGGERRPHLRKLPRSIHHEGTKNTKIRLDRGGGTSSATRPSCPSCLRGGSCGATSRTLPPEVGDEPFFSPAQSAVDSVAKTAAQHPGRRWRRCLILCHGNRGWQPPGGGRGGRPARIPGKSWSGTVLVTKGAEPVGAPRPIGGPNHRYELQAEPLRG